MTTTDLRTDGVMGVHAVDCRAADRTRAGEVIRLGGVAFRLI